MDQGETSRLLAETTVIRKAVRSARLQVRPDGTLRVVAPPSFDVRGFLQRNAAWIEKRRRVLDSLAAEGRGKEEMLLLHGNFYRRVPGTRFTVNEARKTVAYPSAPALRRNLSQLLKEEIRDRLEAYPDLARNWSGRTTVRLQRTRWGSCSVRGNLNFNLRIVALPKPLREYVIVHEAAHLQELNHSERFWRLVSRSYPEHRAAEAELRRYWVIIERNRVWSELAKV